MNLRKYRIGFGLSRHRIGLVVIQCITSEGFIILGVASNFMDYLVARKILLRTHQFDVKSIPFFSILVILPLILGMRSILDFAIELVV